MIQTMFKNKTKKYENGPKIGRAPPPYGKFHTFFFIFIEPFPKEAKGAFMRQVGVLVLLTKLDIIIKEDSSESVVLKKMII